MKEICLKARRLRILKAIHKKNKRYKSYLNRRAIFHEMDCLYKLDNEFKDPTKSSRIGEFDLPKESHISHTPIKLSSGTVVLRSDYDWGYRGYTGMAPFSGFPNKKPGSSPG